MKHTSLDVIQHTFYLPRSHVLSGDMKMFRKSKACQILKYFHFRTTRTKHVLVIFTE